MASDCGMNLTRPSSFLGSTSDFFCGTMTVLPRSVRRIAGQGFGWLEEPFHEPEIVTPMI
jgi:hypothetical protein